MRNKAVPLLSGLLRCPSANADWSAIAQVEHLNVGGNGLHGQFVALEGYAFSGCGGSYAMVTEVILP